MKQGQKETKKNQIGILVLEKKSQAPNGITKPMIPHLDLIPDLIAVLTFTRNVIFISQFGIFWSALMR